MLIRTTATDTEHSLEILIFTENIESQTYNEEMFLAKECFYTTVPDFCYKDLNIRLYDIITYFLNKEIRYNDI